MRIVTHKMHNGDGKYIINLVDVNSDKLKSWVEPDILSAISKTRELAEEYSIKNYQVNSGEESFL